MLGEERGEGGIIRPTKLLPRCSQLRINSPFFEAADLMPYSTLSLQIRTFLTPFRLPHKKSVQRRESDASDISSWCVMMSDFGFQRSNTLFLFSRFQGNLFSFCLTDIPLIPPFPHKLGQIFIKYRIFFLTDTCGMRRRGSNTHIH